MRESAIEAYLRDRVKELGGKAYKFVSPGNTGVPDRLVCLPGGRIAFAELKAPGKKPTAIQRAQHRKFRGLGFIVFGCIDSRADVDMLLRIMNADVTPQDVAQALEELEMMDVE
jgi:hypothetical protein